MKGFDILIKVNGQVVGAQINADLQRQASTTDISNLIALDWKDVLVHQKTWKVDCRGAYILNDKGLAELETAFVEGASVELEVSSPELKFTGEAVIINFPIGATYNKEMTYSISFLGKGPLARERERDPGEIGYCLNPE